MIKYWIAISSILSIPGYASTFVGNGGSAGDLDLSIAIAEINQTFQNLDEQSTPLCECPEDLAENELCRVLRSLTEKQVSFCKEMLVTYRKSIHNLSSSDSRIKFTWYDESIRVEEGNSSTRIVDAVSQREKNEIKLNRPRFLEMPHSFRIALLTHEFFHFVAIGPDFISDEKEIGPFKVGRSLLDALGAAIAIQANMSGVISDFQHLSKVSRAHKKYIFQFDIKSITHTSRNARKLLKSGSSTGSSLSFEYKPKAIGFKLGFEDVFNAPETPGLLSVEETLSIVSLGAGYHWFPVNARLSRWSETHISVFLAPLVGSARYQVKDEVLTLKDKASVAGGQLTLQIHVPLVSGFWGTVGQEARYIQYQYRDLNIKVNETQRIFYLGGAYAY